MISSYESIKYYKYRHVILFYLSFLPQYSAKKMLISSDVYLSIIKMNKEEREGNKEEGKNREGEEDRGIRRVMHCRIERECF